MKSNFQKVMPYIFSEEGGYADNPADPGGPILGLSARCSAPLKLDRL